jgi:hypothetical protein
MTQVYTLIIFKTISMKANSLLLIAIIFNLFMKNAYSEDWRDITIDKFRIEGGNLSSWINEWVTQAADAGLYKNGFQGVEYFGDFNDRSVGSSKINVSDVSALKLLDFISEICAFEFRIIENKIIIQTDIKYNSIKIDVTEKFLSSIGLSNQDLSANSVALNVANALIELGVKVDNSPDSIKIIDNSLVIYVMALDQELLNSIVVISRSGLVVKKMTTNNHPPGPHLPNGQKQ